MDFKIKITCGHCQCNFEVRPGFLPEHHKIACPCCLKALPDEISEKICSGVHALSLVPHDIPRSTPSDSLFDNLLNSSDFSLSVESYSDPTKFNG